MKIDSIRPSEVMKRAESAYFNDVSFYLQNREQFTARLCPGCDSSFFNTFLHHRDFNFSRCESCWTVFMNPGPNESLLRKFYEQSSVYKYWSEFVYPSSKEGRKAKLAIPRAEILIQALSGNMQFNKIVEIGAGTGDVLQEVKKRFPFAHFTAIEPNPDMWSSYEDGVIELMKAGFDVALPQIKEVDLICAFEVVEHLLSPRDFFNRCHSSLKLGGKLVCSTPNAASFEVQSLKGKSNTIDIEHISVLTPAAVHGLARESGYQVDYIITPGEFDIELMSKEFRALKILASVLPAVVKTFQSRISGFGFSSHMKFCLTKI